MFRSLWSSRAFASGALLQLTLSACSGEKPAFVTATRLDQEALSAATVDGSEPEGGRRGVGNASEGISPDPDDAGSGGVAGPDASSPNGTGEPGLIPGSAGTPDGSTPVSQAGPGSSGGTPDDSTRSVKPTTTHQFSIMATRSMDGSLEVKNNWVTQSFALRAETEKTASTFQQEERPLVKARFVQGQDGRPYSETFEQKDVQGVLDVVLVIDNSGSMKEEQTNLSTKLLPLINEVAAADWRIGVVTTSPGEGCMRELIKKSDADAEKNFQQAVRAGTEGSGNEQGFRQAVAALSCRSVDWVRESSTVAVLIVSDEDNCSDGLDCEGQAWEDEAYLLNYLERSMGRSLGSRARVYGLIKHPDDKKCGTAYNVGYQYARAVRQTGGAWGSICASDYTSTLARISADMASILQSQFALEAIPDPQTLGVTARLESGAVTELTGYSVKGNVLSFSNPPPAGSQITVSYETYPESQTHVWDLGSEPLASSLKVTIDGVALQAGDYALRGSILTFARTPPAGSVWEASFRKNLLLNRHFALQGPLVTDSIRASVDGKAATAFSYDPISGFLIFDQAPAESSQIHVTYEKVGKLILEYPIVSPQTQARDLRAQYADNALVELRLEHKDGQHFVVLQNESQVRPGETLWVHYREPASAPENYKLPAPPLAGSLRLASSHATCHPGAGIFAAGQTLTIDCGDADDFQVDYAFETEVEATRSFKIDGLEGPVSRLQVLVDGESLEAGDFRVDQGTLTLDAGVPLSHGSVVRVILEADGD